MAVKSQSKVGAWTKLVRWLAGEEASVEMLAKKEPRKLGKVTRIKSKDTILDVAKFYHIKKKYVVIVEKKVAKKPASTPKKPAAKATPAKPASGSAAKKPSVNAKNNKKH